MESRRERKAVIGATAGAIAAIITYRLFYPVQYSELVSASLLVLTAVLALSIEGTRYEDRHLIAMAQKKAYAISWKSTILTTLITGVMMLFLLYAAAFIVGFMSYTVGGPTMTSAVLIDIINRIELLGNLHAIEIGIGYLIASTTLATGFWLLYPYLPTQDEEIAAPVAFMIAAVYTVGVFYLLAPNYVYIDHPIHFALDAALIATWGKFFAEVYEYVEKYLI